MSIEEYFRTGAAFERPIFEAVARHVERVGTITIEPLSVGILFKRSSTFAELRPKRDRVELSFMLSRPLEHPRIARTWKGPGERRAFFIKIRDAAEVDDEIKDWLTEAYLQSPE